MIYSGALWACKTIDGVDCESPILFGLSFARGGTFTAGFFGPSPFGYNLESGKYTIVPEARLPLLTAVPASRVFLEVACPQCLKNPLRCAELARTRAIPQRDHPHVYRDYILSEPIEVRNQQSQYCRKLNNGDREPILLEAPAENIEVEGLVRLHKST